MSRRPPEYQREWRRKNPDSSRASTAKWRAATSDKFKAYQAAYAKSKRKEINARRAKWRDNPERRKKECEAAKAYAQANRSKVRETKRRYAETHPDASRRHERTRSPRPEKRRVYEWRREANKRSAGGRGITDRDWGEIKEINDHRCAYCLERFDRLALEHVTALACGGDHDVDNAVSACTRCNSRKGDRGVLFMVRYIR